MAKKPEPRCRAVVLCDVIYRDEDTKKLILVGTFHVVHTLKLPCVHPAMSLYLAINEGLGQYGFRIVVEHVDTQQRVFETKGPLDFADPNQLIEINAPMNGLQFVNKGRYDIQVWADDYMIGQTSFFVNLVPQG
jgi:hypothetical protein